MLYTFHTEILSPPHFNAIQDLNPAIGEQVYIEM